VILQSSNEIFSAMHIRALNTEYPIPHMKGTAS
jgi:hypothetical protein